jgi:PAS domain S-box-containing protein
LEKAAAEGPFKCEGWRVRKDGRRFLANVVITCLRNREGRILAFVKVVRDLTGDRSAEQRLRETEDRYRALAKAVDNHATFMMDPGGNVVSWNRRAEDMNGYTAEEIIGRHFSKLHTPEAIAEGWPAHILEVANSEGQVAEECWRLRKDGSTFWAYVMITAQLNEHGHLSGFSIVTRDLAGSQHTESGHDGPRTVGR